FQIISYLLSMNKGTKWNVLKQLDMTTNQWAWNSTCWTIAAIIGEVPSNLLLKKTGVRLHFMRIVVLWSIMGACGAAAQNKSGLLVTRFLLGIFECGMYPGILSQLTYWYRRDEIAVRMIVVGGAAAFSGIFTALYAWGITYMNGVHGIAAWRWALLILSLCGVPVGAIVYFFLPTFPWEAKFLTERERAILQCRLPPAQAKRADANFDWPAIRKDLSDPLFWSFTGIQVFQGVGTYGLQFWLPSIITSFGFTTTQSSQLLNIPGAAVGLSVGIFFAWLSQRTLSIPRPVYIIGVISVTFTGFFCLAFVRNKPALYALTIIASSASSAFYAMLYPWRAQTLVGATSTAFVFSFQISAGQISGIIGRCGYLANFHHSRYAPRYTVPFMVCVGFQSLAVLSTLSAWYFSRNLEKISREETKQRRREEKEQKIEQKFEQTPAQNDDIVVEPRQLKEWGV
ncbi:major facilitator superfamily domain-containing protein, partial [Naematelia encephala]